ncbi:uncharacterized protein LOC122391661 [Amphibalanus amphitrite]|uniref:uncharacterized protein LOC122391661 n=1 Tax=Amphibalanus amphitrite TaxID=1232801 RepID=UPI001C913A6C|nr:uncharacterized protein LOC122391661 [Amphibalanus amphitrite]
MLKLNTLTPGQLRIMLDKMGQDTQGSKPVLIERLKTCLGHDSVPSEVPSDRLLFECNGAASPVEPGSRLQTSHIQEYAYNTYAKRAVYDDYDTASCISAQSSIASEKAKLAGLQARAACLKQKQELDRQAQNIHAMQEALELDMQIKEVAAREAALKNEVKGQTRDHVTSQPINVSMSRESTSKFELSSYRDHVIESLPSHSHDDAAYQLAKRFHLPMLEMSTFDGDLGKYRCFMRAFHANIVAKVSNEEEKLSYLHQYTRGRPREIVSTCLHLPPEQGFTEAISLLERRYGGTIQVAAGLVDQLLQCSNLKADDVEGLETFAIQLRGSMNALSNLPCGTGAVDVKTIRLLLEKVPPFFRDKWRVKVDEIEQTDHRQAEFKDFVLFIEREARIACNPSYGRHVTSQNAKQLYGERKPGPGNSVRGKLLSGNVNPSRFPLTCLQCDQNHEISECPQLGRMKRDEKIEFIHSNRLCFGCLRPNHTAKYCKDRKICKTCQGSHPTALHFDRQESFLPTVTSGHLASRGGAKLQVVPVRVTLLGVTVPTSAFLDSGSTHSFISRQLLDQLGAQPTENTSVTLSTINSDQRIATCMVSRVIMEDLDITSRLELPPLIVLNRIPVSKEDAPDANDLKKWPYLINGGVNLEENVPGDVGLLIGNNVAAVMEPIEVVPSQNGGPFAVRTRFGWVLGGAEKATNSRLKVNIHQTQLTFDEDSCGNRAEYKTGPSAEDLIWHSIVESSCTFRNGQYEIALPFRSSCPVLPNNKLIAHRRLEQLRRRFQNQPNFAEEYTRQMTKLLEKGYAEDAPESSHIRDGSVWFLPHHGIEQSGKKDKIRVVFDCACQFQGTSLNDELLRGPDFTNSLTDVLLRFRQGPVAFMADIEGMFLQVKVPEHQRDFLRFLWWPDGNIKASPKQYRMTVHLFGATSSPSCANFALRRTATDHGTVYDRQVPGTVLNNFYVDDCLVTTTSENDAINLALSLKQLCSKGGFNLTKFTSNSVIVLDSIPEADHSPKIKSLNLRIDTLPTDRALGVSWNVQSDRLGYQLELSKFTGKPLTRRGMLSAIAAFYDPLGLAAPYVMRARMLLQELTRLRLGWDQSVPGEYCKQWRRWVADLGLLSLYTLPRCICQSGFSASTRLELHHFSDASERGYGVASYLRVVTQEGRTSCTLLCSRCHLAPIKPLSIPRLELSAATLAVKVNLELERALEFKVQPCRYFWTDSTTVLYI